MTITHRQILKALDQHLAERYDNKARDYYEKELRADRISFLSGVIAVLKLQKENSLQFLRKI